MRNCAWNCCGLTSLIGAVRVGTWELGVLQQPFSRFSPFECSRCSKVLLKLRFASVDDVRIELCW
jgi:hypothetical protein